MVGGLSPGWGGSSIWIAPDALEAEAKVLPQLANGLPMLRIRIPVLRTYNDDFERWVMPPAWGQHGCDERVSLRTAQRQEQGHHALHVSLEADVLLNKRAGGRPIGTRRVVAWISELVT
jgi:hypothetical protein